MTFARPCVAQKAEPPMEKLRSRDLPKEQAEAYVEKLLQEEREHRLIPGLLENAVGSLEFKARSPNVWEALFERLTELGRVPAEMRKQLELLIETVPKVRRVAILSNPTNLAHPLWVRKIKDAGRPLGVQLQFVEARGPTEFDAHSRRSPKSAQEHSSSSQTRCSYSTEHGSQTS